MIRQAIFKEPLQLKYVKKTPELIPDVTGFIDVGANLGIYTIFAANSRLYNYVHAFEPSPDTFEELKRNVALNKNCANSSVKLHNLAISDQNQALQFELRQQFGTGNRVKPEGSANTVVVNARRLDDILDPWSQSEGRNLYVKIDVEGHELEALSGAYETLSRRVAFLQIESWPGAQGHRTEMREFLAPMGFSLLFRVKGDHFFLHEQYKEHEIALQELFWAAFHRSYKLISEFARDGRSVFDNPSLRDEFLELFNGHPGVRPHRRK